MKENKLNHIEIVLSSDIIGMKVWNCLLEIITHSVVNNIGRLGNLKPTTGLSMLKMSIIIIISIGKWIADQNWADYVEEGDEEEYVWQEGQWCPGGLTRSQKKKGTTPKE